MDHHRFLGLLTPTWVALAMCVSGAGAAAQTPVLGVVRDEASGQPVETAFVALLGAGGEVVTATLTTPAGAFRLGAPAPGEYRVRVERIGYRTTVSDPFSVVAGAELPFLALAVPEEALSLEGIEVEGASRCRVRPDEGEATARVWDQVKKVLTVASWAQGEGVLQYRMVRFDRRLDPARLRVKEEHRERLAGFHGGSPFVSSPVEELQADGFVQELRDGSYRYLAPDADVLLSDRFLDTHCFRLRRDDAPDDGWIGLAFEPVRRGGIADIEGVLWVDAATARLQRLDYGYTWLPEGLETDKVGGRIEFEQVPQGPWIVHDWWIRMPVIGLRREYPAPGLPAQNVAVLMEVAETGGEVTEVRAPDGSPLLQAQTAAVAGVVFDSAAAQPLRGAHVVLVGTAFQTTTDADGGFALGGLPRGRYEITFESPRLDDLGWTADAVPVELALGETSSVSLAIPPMERILGERCRDPVTDEQGSAVLTGRVIGGKGSTAVPEGLEVVMTWETGSIGPGARRGSVVVSQGSRTVRTPVGGSGRYFVCGLPPERQIRVWTELAERPAADTASVRLARGELRRQDVPVPPPVPRPGASPGSPR